MADRIVAVYYVHWTIGRVDHGANFDLIVGKWGNGTSADDRLAVSLAYRLTQQGPEFMVIDSTGRPYVASQLVGKALSRKEISDTALGNDVFAYVDAIVAQDDRIAEILGR